MRKHPSHIANEFAEVFEWSQDDNNVMDDTSYFRYRDDFYQLVRSDLRNGVESQETIEERFSRCPRISNGVLLPFAAGNAEYYARILGIHAPKWCDDIPPLPEALVPFFPFPIIVGTLEDVIRNTPEELRRRGFIYDEHNFTIY